jgi:VWFA-related protein
LVRSFYQRRFNAHFRNNSLHRAVYTDSTSPRSNMPKRKSERLLLAGCLLALLPFAARAAYSQDAPFPPTNGDPFPQPGSAAQKPGQPFTLSVTTRVVVIDVVVVDKKGNLVRRSDLTRDDFTIYEDGKPQRVRSFETPSAHAMPASENAIVNSAADLRKIGDAPVTILVLDELNSRFEDMSFSRNAMIKYLQSQPPVLKEPTVLMIAMNTTFQQVHDYTQDRDALIQVVKKHMPEYPWRMMNSGKGGPGAAERMAQVLAALQQISQASIGTPGRKNLIWVGNGFPSSDLTLLDPVTANTIETAVKRVTNRMLAARITMFSIDPTPGSTSTLEVDTPEDMALSQNENYSDPFGDAGISFSTLAPSTGGKAFRGRNDINNEIGEGIASGSFYYTMSYTPSNASTDAAQYRKIQIRMKDPSLHATTRDGYYPETAAQANPVLDKEIKPKQAKANLQLELSGALTSTISYNGLNITAAKSGDGVYRILVQDAGLSWTPSPEGGETAEATLAAGWYDAKNKLLGHVAREQVAQRGATPGGAAFTLPITVPSNAVRLRILARDALTGHMGTVDITKF